MTRLISRLVEERTLHGCVVVVCDVEFTGWLPVFIHLHEVPPWPFRLVGVKGNLEGVISLVVVEATINPSSYVLVIFRAVQIMYT